MKENWSPLLVFFFTWSLLRGFPGNCAFCCANCSEGTVWRGVIEAISVSSFNTQYRSSSNGSSCPLRLPYHHDLGSCVCDHGWTGRGFYSLAALMLLEIRMLTQSLIWLHRSQPSQWNHINTNNVRYKLCSSLYPSLSLFTSASLSVLI